VSDDVSRLHLFRHADTTAPNPPAARSWCVCVREEERATERERERQRACVCVCVCMGESDRERDIDRKRAIERNVVCRGGSTARLTPPPRTPLLPRTREISEREREREREMERVCIKERE